MNINASLHPTMASKTSGKLIGGHRGKETAYDVEKNCDLITALAKGDHYWNLYISSSDPFRVCTTYGSPGKDSAKGAIIVGNVRKAKFDTEEERDIWIAAEVEKKKKDGFMEIDEASSYTTAVYETAKGEAG
jgi:hypothetical protein